MNSGKGLCIMLLTYNRLDYAKRTLYEALNCLEYTRGPLSIHIASDGDTDEYIAELVLLAKWYQCGELRATGGRLVTVSNSHRGGYGASYNAATGVVHQIEGMEYILPLEDDWELSRHLDLDVLTLAIDQFADEGNRTYGFKPGCIRLSYLAHTQKLSGFPVWINNNNYLALEPSSEELHVFSGNPRLETVEWERRVGLWTEHLTQGETEVEVARRLEAREGVCFPIDLVKPSGDLFYHIGTVKADMVLANV